MYFSVRLHKILKGHISAIANNRAILSNPIAIVLGSVQLLLGSVHLIKVKSAALAAQIASGHFHIGN